MPTYSGNKITVDSESKNIDIALSSGNAVLVSVEASAFSGTVDFQSTIDGETYTNHPYIPYNSAAPSRSVSQLSSPTTYAAYVILPPLTQVRIAVAYTSGSLEVVWREIDYKSVDPTTAATTSPHTIASHSDTTATGAELEELTDGSETTLHSHADVDHAKYLDSEAIAAVEGEATLTLASGTTIGGSPAVVDSDIGGSVQAQADLLDDIAAIIAAGGDILYVDVSGDIVKLAKGADGQVLTLASGFPSWAAAGTPGAHASTHQNGGSDEVSVAGLSGVLADDQHVIDAEAVAAVEAAGLSTPDLGTPSAINLANATGLSLTKSELDTVVSDGNPMFDGDAPTAHTIASHSDTTATGAELEELTDGSETTLHSHADVDHAKYLDSEAIAAVEGEATLTLAAGTTSGGSPVLVDSDIGSTVQAYDATIVVDADIGGSVQAQSAVLDTFAAGTDVTVAQGGTGVSTLTGHLKGNGTSAITGSTDVELASGESVNINTPLLTGGDHTITGLSAEMLAGGAIGAMDAVCIHTVTQEIVVADASVVATARAIGFAPSAISDTATGTILLQGFVRDDTWNWTTGGAIYLSETGGSVTQTAPTTSGAFVQVVGVALSPDVMYFNPDMSIIELA